MMRLIPTALSLSLLLACGDINVPPADKDPECTPYCDGQQAYGCKEGKNILAQTCGGDSTCSQGVCIPVVVDDAGDPDTGTSDEGTPCTPSCDGAECGPDGCGDECGTCDGGKTCENKSCVCAPNASSGCHEGNVHWFDACGAPGEQVADCVGKGCTGGVCDGCSPACEGAECGADGCGGDCGTCDGGAVCTDKACVCTAGASTACHEGDVWAFDSCGKPGAQVIPCEDGCTDGTCDGCAPSCEGVACGPDGCGGECGTCEGGAVCADGACICTAGASTGCHEGDVWAFDSCGKPGSEILACDNGCTAGACDGCTPACDGLDCGPDGCGGSCGTCSGGQVCVAGGTCACEADAEEKCHEDENVWTFDSCGVATELVTTCDFGCDEGECQDCVASCAGKDCGADGCGGSCGTCVGGKVCTPAGLCQCAPNATKKCKDGDVWNVDSCGNVTDPATKCEFGCSGGICLACAPDCAGKACGADGCGGSCGDCGAGAECTSDFGCECICEGKTCSDVGFTCGTLGCDLSTCVQDTGGCGKASKPWDGWDKAYKPLILADKSLILKVIGDLTGECANNGGTAPTWEELRIGDSGFVGLPPFELRSVGGVTFSIEGLPKGAKIVSASLHLYQQKIIGDAYKSPMEQVVVEHVRYEKLGSLCLAKTIVTAISQEVLSTSGKAGWRSVDITDVIRYDIATCQDKTQLRIAFTPKNGMDDNASNQAVFASDDASTNIPYLSVTYRL